MNFPAIIREIDAEIERLVAARSVIAELASPPPPRTETATPQLASDTFVKESPLAVTQPPVVVVPAKQKREYRPRIRHSVPLANALATAPTERPVVIPPPAANLSSRPPSGATLLADDDLEAKIRRNLFGGAVVSEPAFKG